jgi:hypothetical protein
MKTTATKSEQIVNGFPGDNPEARIGAVLAAVRNAQEVANAANPIRGGAIRSPLMAYAQELTQAVTDVLNDRSESGERRAGGLG